MSSNLNDIDKNYGFKTHAFVLMNNHYHLVGSASEDYTLGEIMCRFQTNTSKAIGHYAGRINHVYGGPYKASLILNPSYYFNVIKYVYQNPLRANLCLKVQDYTFSSVRSGPDLKFNLYKPENGIDEFLPTIESDFLEWLNQSANEDVVEIIRKGLKKTLFKISDKNRKIPANSIRI